ncbi:MATE efflux family protein [Cyanobacterium stanieri PCC 7202]|uniref:MATE efflux family protein n=1 Tax=Cyanobacterium stanieri (strain ATCC 29140 / PCC 7202) TaxID=292563 RepID=K9YHZ2_CYASC|nr:MATE efflux family protein [Cyanobacterium stanieri PCC 7202]
MLFYHRFFRLTIVNILSNLMIPLASLVDMAFLGHLNDISHLAGVSLASVIFNYLYWTFGFLRMGTTGITAQAKGKNNDQEITAILLRNGVIALLIGITILIFQLPLQKLGFNLLTATDTVKMSGIEYYNSLIWAAPTTLLNFVLIGWLLGLEKGGQVLLLSFINKATNIILDYIFIVRWGWESSGAGSATAISQYLTSLIGIILVIKIINPSSIINQIKDVWHPEIIVKLFILNRDILIRTFALISTFALFTNFSSHLGTITLATNSLLLQGVSFSAYFIDGIAFATESLAGISYGSKNYQQLIKLLKISGIMSLFLGIFFAIVLVLFSNFIFSFLTNHEEIIINIKNYVYWLIPVVGIGSIAYMLDGYFIGLTQGNLLRNSSLIASIGGFFPPAIMGWYFQNNHLLWLALSIFMMMRVTTLSYGLINSSIFHPPSKIP